MANPTGTNPGLTYDPRNGQSAAFWAAVEKDMAKQTSKNAGPRGKNKDFQNPTPLPDFGKPITGSFANPRFTVKAGLAIRV